MTGHAGGDQVKRAKSGNSQALPVPSDLARAAHLDVGDTVPVEVRGGDVAYRRRPAGAAIIGEGRNRVAVAARGQSQLHSGRSVSDGLDTWDF